MLITTDLHFTDKDSDAYRFDIFPWLEEQIEKYDEEYLLILGDLTDSKDKHSSKLVNKIVDGLEKLSHNVYIHILKGNHDYIDAQNPFFKFLGNIPNFYYYNDIGRAIAENWLFLPHTRTPEHDWADLNLTDIDYVFMHESVIGSVASDYYKIEHGISNKFFKNWPKNIEIISGDIHLPQTCGRVEYVGSPYRIRLGDTFDPRVMLIQDGQKTDLKFPCLSKMTIEINDPDDLLDYTVNKNDQVKIRLKINKASFPEWDSMKAEILEIMNGMGADVKGIELITSKRRTPIKDREVTKISKGGTEEAIRQYSTLEKLDSYTTKIGVSLAKGDQL